MNTAVPDGKQQAGRTRDHHLRNAADIRRKHPPEGMCQELLAHAAALWTFVREDGVEPTGYPRVRAPCQQQQRHLLTFVTEAITAYWAGRPAPTLLPATALNVP